MRPIAKPKSRIEITGTRDLAATDLAILKLLHEHPGDAKLHSEHGDLTELRSSLDRLMAVEVIASPPVNVD